MEKNIILGLSRIQTIMINTPCVRNCCLDEKDICLGCNRTLEEIIGWSAMDDEQKKQVLSFCQDRAKARKSGQLKSPKSDN